MLKIHLILICSILISSCNYFNNKTLERAERCSKYIFCPVDIGPETSKKIFNIQPLILTKWNPPESYFSIDLFGGYDGQIWLELSINIRRDSVIEAESRLEFFFEEALMTSYSFPKIKSDRDLYFQIEKDQQKFQKLKDHKLKFIVFHSNKVNKYEIPVDLKFQDYFMSVLPCMEASGVRNWFLNNELYIRFKE